MQPTRQSEDTDLALLVQALWRRAWVIALCVAAATLAAAGLTAWAEERYEARGALLVSASAAVDPDRAIDTSLQVLSLSVIAERAAARIPGVSAVDVQGAIEVDQEGDSDIIEVKANASSPALAGRIANAFMDEFLTFRVGADPKRFEEGRIEIIERASASETPVSPKPARNFAFGALVGLVLGLGLALLLEQFDRRIKRADDLAEATGLPRLAAVPKLAAFDAEHLGQGPLSTAETEIFRMLRANLRYFNVERKVKSVLVTSAEPGEGKTLVSLGLALAAVTSGERVLLIEADMRDPGLSEMLGLDDAQGLSKALSRGGAGMLTDAVAAVEAGKLSDAIGGANLDVLPAGPVPPNPTELIESQRMRDLISEAEQRYDFIVIDTPPILAVSDAVPLIANVNGVLAVSGLGVSTRSAAVDLAEKLERLGAPVLGAVANFAESRGHGYGGYGYGRPPELGLQDQ